MYQSIPKPAIPPRAIPGHLTHVKLRTVGNLTQSEAHPVGHLALVSKRVSAVGNRRISQFFHSAHVPLSRVIPRGFFLLLSLHCIVISWNMPLFKVWSEDKLNKKFRVPENCAELVSKGIYPNSSQLLTTEYVHLNKRFDPLWSSKGGFPLSRNFYVRTDVNLNWLYVRKLK